jgi:hypothetical protein
VKIRKLASRKAASTQRKHHHFQSWQNRLFMKYLLTRCALVIVTDCARRFLTLDNNMLPDYPHKIFNDKRACYCLLMETLAMLDLLGSVE